MRDTQRVCCVKGTTAMRARDTLGELVARGSERGMLSTREGEKRNEVEKEERINTDVAVRKVWLSFFIGRIGLHARMASM